jgi:hypothetical protein
MNVISCGVRLLVALVLLAGVACARRNSGMGMRWVIGQDTIGATAVQGEPCRIMACVSGLGMLALAARGADTSERRSR